MALPRKFADYPLDQEKITSGDHKQLYDYMRLLVKELRRSYDDFYLALRDVPGSESFVTGPPSSVDSNIVAFNGTTGGSIKDSGVGIQTELEDTDDYIPTSKAVKTYGDANWLGVSNFHEDIDLGTSAAPDDEIVIWDVSAADYRRITRADFIGSSTGLWDSDGSHLYPSDDALDVAVYNNRSLTLCNASLADDNAIYMKPYDSSTGYSLLIKGRNLADQDYLFYARQTFDDTTALSADRVMYNFFSQFVINAGQADGAANQTVWRHYFAYGDQAHRGSHIGFLARLFLSGTNNRSVGVKDSAGLGFYMDASGSGGMLTNEIRHIITGDNMMRGLDINLINNYGTGGTYYGWINDPAGFDNVPASVGLWIRSEGDYNAYQAIAVKGLFEYVLDVRNATIATCGIDLSNPTTTITSGKAIAIARGDYIDLSGDQNQGHYYIRRQPSGNAIQLTAGGVSALLLYSSYIWSQLPLSVSGNLSISGDISVTGKVDGIDISAYLNQAVKTSSRPTFAGLYATNDIILSNAQYLYGKSSGGTSYLLIGMASSNDIGIASGAPSKIQIGASASWSNPIHIRVGGVNGRQVTAGPANSGGTGYRVLRVPN